MGEPITPKDPSIAPSTSENTKTGGRLPEWFNRFRERSSGGHQTLEDATLQHHIVTERQRAAGTQSLTATQQQAAVQEAPVATPPLGEAQPKP